MRSSPFDREPFAGCLRMSGVHSGAGPGLSSYFEIAAVAHLERTQLWYWGDDLPNPEPLLEPIEGPGTPQNIARAMADEYDLQLAMSLDKVRVTGTSSVGAELLALAISGSHEDKLVARLLSVLGDRALEQLHASEGPFFTPVFQAAASRIAEEAWEEDIDLGILGESLRSSAPTRPMTLATLAHAVNTSTKVVREAEGIRKLREEEQLTPFSERIKALVDEWRRRRPVRSSMEHRVRDMISGQMLSYLRAYVLQHHELPTGVHKISGHGNVSGSSTVDFDSLMDSIRA